MKTAFVYPGQGSQQIGMSKDFYDEFAEVRELYAKASEVLGYDLAKLSFEGPEEELNKTVITQPALLTASIAAHTALTLKGVKPDAVAGHSLGEYTANVAAGTFAFADAVKLAQFRGGIMQEAVPEGKGMMAAVLGLKRDVVDSVCSSLETGYAAPTNYNCPGQIVIAGETKAVEDAMEKLKEAGAKRVIPLAVSVPSHSKMMDGAASKLSEYLFLGDIEMSDPSIPINSNSDAIFLSTVDGVKAALVKQLNNPILWEYCVASMVHAGIDTFVEVGPGKVISGLVRRCDKSVRTLNVSDMTSLDNTIKELSG